MVSSHRHVQQQWEWLLERCCHWSQGPLSPLICCTPLHRIREPFTWETHGIPLIPTSSPPPLTSSSALFQLYCSAGLYIESWHLQMGLFASTVHPSSLPPIILLHSSLPLLSSSLYYAVVLCTESIFASTVFLLMPTSSPSLTHPSLSLSSCTMVPPVDAMFISYPSFLIAPFFLLLLLSPYTILIREYPEFYI